MLTDSSCKRKKIEKLIERFEPNELEITEETLTLSEKYIPELTLPEKAIDDSIHAAIGTVYEMDALIT